MSAVTNRTTAPVTRPTTSSPTTAAAKTADTGQAARAAAQATADLNNAYDDAMKQLDATDGTLTTMDGKNSADASYWFSDSQLKEFKAPYVKALNDLKNKPGMTADEFKKQAADIVKEFNYSPGKDDKTSPGYLQNMQMFVNIFLHNCLDSMNRLYANVMKSFGGG